MKFILQSLKLLEEGPEEKVHLELTDVPLMFFESNKTYTPACVAMRRAKKVALSRCEPDINSANLNYSISRPYFSNVNYRRKHYYVGNYMIFSYNWELLATLALRKKEYERYLKYNEKNIGYLPVFFLYSKDIKDTMITTIKSDISKYYLNTLYSYTLSPLMVKEDLNSFFTKEEIDIEKSIKLHNNLKKLLK